jgi:hypothetical protein
MTFKLPPAWSLHPSHHTISHDVCGHVVTAKQIKAHGFKALLHVCQIKIKCQPKPTN